MKDIDKLNISKGIAYLADGYIDYAEEVIAERAIVNLYDGLKPVNRRILHTGRENKCDKRFKKSQKLAGDTLTYHPHSADTIYKASVLMCDRHGSWAFPVLHGSGSFGDVSSGEEASAMRYTEEMLHENSKEFFGEMDGVDMIPNFDSTSSEPLVLPVSFPSVLVNPSEGIAVGFSSKIPSFNFNDVIDLCIEYIDNGECSTVIYPDFTTRGYCVKNSKEAKKLMVAGKASFKLRGKVTLRGNEIFVTEVPFGKTAISLSKQISKKEIKGIKNFGNLSDFDGTGLLVQCTSKRAVDGVLYDLYKETDLQYNYNASIVVVQDGVPRLMGVWKVIEEWIKWRKTVVEKHLKHEEDVLKQSIKDCESFMKLIELGDVKDEFVALVSTQGRKSAIEWLKPKIKGIIPDDEIDFVTTRRLDYYHTGGKYATQYETMKANLDDVKNKLEDINKTLREQFVRLKNQYGVNMPRLTELTTTDYEFLREKDEPVKDTSSCIYTLKDNFLKKMRYVDSENDYEYQFEGTASDILVAFDNMGRVLRIYAQDIPLSGQFDTGVYLPRYLEVGEVSDDYKIMWIGTVDGSEKTLVYNDGNVGFLDTSEWLDSGRQVRVLKNGIHKDAHKIVAVLDELPEVMIATDNQGRVGWVNTENIKHKNRTARTRVWNLKEDCVLSGLCCCSMVDATVILGNMDRYESPKLRNLESEEDYRGDGTEFMSL